MTSRVQPEVGICDCETGWQGTACNISAEAAQGSEDMVNPAETDSV